MAVMNLSYDYTEFLCAAVFEDYRLCGVESAASEEVAELEAVDETVTTVPEIEQVEHLTYICVYTYTQHDDTVNGCRAESKALCLRMLFLELIARHRTCSTVFHCSTVFFIFS